MTPEISTAAVVIAVSAAGLGLKYYASRRASREERIGKEMAVILIFTIIFCTVVLFS